ncbi:MAG: hypothetical protein P9M15_08255 [Candidatus Electryoneaceae bacterium]|nr:hypothetical protein [Candidatus Electryoneaceae bacterium]
MGIQQRPFSAGISYLIILSLVIPLAHVAQAAIYDADEYAILLPELLDRADDVFDLDEQDAVILQDYYHLYLQSDGRLRTIVQRTV